VGSDRGGARGVRIAEHGVTADPLGLADATGSAGVGSSGAATTLEIPIGSSNGVAPAVASPAPSPGGAAAGQRGQHLSREDEESSLTSALRDAVSDVAAFLIGQSCQDVTGLRGSAPGTSHAEQGGVVVDCGTLVTDANMLETEFIVSAADGTTSSKSFTGEEGFPAAAGPAPADVEEVSPASPLTDPEDAAGVYESDPASARVSGDAAWAASLYGPEASTAVGIGTGADGAGGPRAVDLDNIEGENAEVVQSESDEVPVLQEPPADEDHFGDGAASESEDEGEPAWLDLPLPDEDPTEEAADAQVRAAFLDGLVSGSEECDLAYEQYLPRLARYLIGHPQGLICGRRGFSKGKGKRYFGDGRSEDVMADKVVKGCWACGKLDHESHECDFKRCFVCSQQGHEFSECAHRSEKCERCNRSGHTDEECPEAVYDEGLQNDADVFHCRCMKCYADGHLNCSAVPACDSGAPAWRPDDTAPGSPPQPWQPQQWGPPLRPALRPGLRPPLRLLEPSARAPMRRVVIAPLPPRPGAPGARPTRPVPWRPQGTGGVGGSPRETPLPVSWGPQPPSHPPPWWRGPPLVYPRRPRLAGASALRPPAAPPEWQVRRGKRPAEQEPDWPDWPQEGEIEEPLWEESPPSGRDDWPAEAHDASCGGRSARVVLVRSSPGDMDGSTEAPRAFPRGRRKLQRRH